MRTLPSMSQRSRLENMCRKYAEPVGESEISRCTRAERMVSNAIKQSSVFDVDQLAQISIFAQGSYKNGTNVPQDSDVDIAICYKGSFFYYPTQVVSLSSSISYISPAPYRYEAFRNDIIRSLYSVFGKGLYVGNKSLKISGNLGRVNADIVPCFEFKHFSPYGSPLIGTGFIASDGAIIENWPHQHYYFGVKKNKATNFRFKKVVRILKSLRKNIEYAGYFPVSKTASFLVESLAWNAPDICFRDISLFDNCNSVLHTLFEMLQDNEKIDKMTEVNGMKLLFSPEQPWSIQDACSFVYCSGKELELW
ncbi:MAG: nucleotidyltransferase [Alphaproteobacteria bacterium]|nr:nucleotidyltransferase [Alphaproteobacteria bacterium]